MPEVPCRSVVCFWGKKIPAGKSGKSNRSAGRRQARKMVSSAGTADFGIQIAHSRGMGKRIQDWIEQYRHMDWAVLYMRLFAGGMMLFHNIGKIQDYNEIITSYPSLPLIGSAATFVLAAVAEVLLSVLIIMGLWVRTAALLMALGIAAVLVWGGFGASELEFVWLGIYVFLVISGGGLYGFDTALSPAKSKK